MNITAFGTLEIQADASSQASVEYFLIAGYTHGARIANDVLGLISDIIRGLDVLKQQRQVASHEPKGHA
jgi:hypothetical protein